MTSFERAARAHINSRGSEGTKKLYFADLAAWLLHCELEAGDVENPTLELATSFRDKLKQKVGSQSVRRTLSALSSIYDAAGITNFFKSSRRLHRPPPNEVALTKEYTTEEAQALIAAAEAEHHSIGPRDAAVMRILYGTGMRIGSVLAMRRERLIRRDKQLSVLVEVKKKGLVEVVFPDDAAEALNRWLRMAPDSMYVFPSRSGGHLTTQAINERFEIYGKMLGIKDPPAHPHRFRATFITEALDAGVPLHEVQAAVHHSSPNVTLRYDRRQRGTGVTATVAQYRKDKNA